MIFQNDVQIKHKFLADKFKLPNIWNANSDVSKNSTEPETKSVDPSQLTNQNQESRNAASNGIWQILKQPKQQQNDVQPIVAASKISENINKQQSVITEVKGLPEMMENLLKSQPAAFAPQIPMPTMHHEQFRKINIEDMFKVDTSNLPQPPPNWRNKMAPTSGGLPEEWSASVPPPVPAANSIPTGHARPIKGAGKSKGNDNLFYSSGSDVAAPKSNDGIYHPQPMNMFPQMINRQPPLGPPPPQQTKTFYQVSFTQIKILTL